MLAGKNQYGFVNMNDTDNTYAGFRSDLRDGVNDPLTIVDIEKLALQLADQRFGVTAYTLSEAAGCSKEWARKILLRMEEEGMLKVIQYSQLKVYRRKKCEYCNGTGKVPVQYTGQKRWWENYIISPQLLPKTEFIDCECGG